VTDKQGSKGPQYRSKAKATGEGTGLGRRRERAKEQGGARSAATRVTVMRAAAEVFRDYGLSRMSLQAVADRAGVDRATIYYYFASKESLFKELVYAVVMANVADAESIASSTLPVEEKLSQVIRGLMRSFAEHDPYAAVYVEEYLSRRDKEPAALILGMVNSSVRWLRHPTVAESLRVAELMAELILDGLASGVSLK
jgi:TetR/AcrR family transcriptional regulator, cholesterol catabolism regulator